jgi:4-amino-4-deoxy-L-arabinose transferase-like glycosyltransferase
MKQENHIGADSSNTALGLRLGRTTGRAAIPVWPWPPALAVFLICYWVAVTALLNPAQYADSIEQFNWAHSLELGYWKHPPLTTWLMRAAIVLAGPSEFVSYTLAALCYGGMAFFTWKIAAMLMPPRGAALAVLLLTLHHGFTWRAQIYNHNAVLVLMASAFVWSSLRAARNGRRRDWLMAGALAGLALLTKYQAVLPIASVLFGLWHSGALRDRAARRNVALATMVGVLVFLPHAVWALQQGIPTLQYLEESATPVAEGARDLAWLKFFANQLSLHFPMLVVAAILAIGRAAPPQESRDENAAALPHHLPLRSWLLALVAMPVLLVSAVILFGGIAPQKYWGLQTLQFFPLLLAWLLERRRRRFQVAKAAALCIAISLGGTSYYAVESVDRDALRKLHSMDRIWPAKELAAAALADWRSVTNCPLKYVVGPALPAGLVSVYSGVYPAVLENNDPRKSPWIDAADLQDAGAIAITGPLPIDQPLAPGAHGFEVPAKQSEGGVARVQWRILAPRGVCLPPQAP